MSHPVIDAHQHFWDPDRVDYPWLTAETPEIHRRFGVDDLLPHLRAHGVDGTVLVQAADSDADTDAMFAIAAAHPEILGVVAYLPLHDPAAAADRLAVLQRREKFVGVRTLIHDQPDPDWLLRADVSDGLRLLEQADVPFDLVAVLPRHLEHIGCLSERFPDLRMVVDHLAKPPVRTTRTEPWTTLIRRAAANPRVFAKVSGLYPATGDWAAHTAADLVPWVDAALDAFGPERLMIGSDWPVSVLAGGYDVVWSELVQILHGHGEAVSGPVLGATAAGYYGLAVR